jgi:hypothetical protein
VLAESYPVMRDVDHCLLQDLCMANMRPLPAKAYYDETSVGRQLDCNERSTALSERELQGDLL